MTSVLDWSFGIVLPIALMTSVGGLVAVRAETRRKSAERTVRKLTAWLRTSNRLVVRHKTLSTQVENVAKDPTWRKRVLRGMYGIAVTWTNTRSRPGNYLREGLRDQVSDWKTYMEGKERDYRAQREADKAAGRKMIKTSLGLEALLETNGWVVAGGIVVTILGTGLAWVLSQDYPGAGVEWIVGVVLLWFVVGLARDKARSFALGCAIVVYLCLTTLEVSPLDGSAFEEAIDAQRVTAMFLGVAIMLTLCQFFGREGALGDIGAYERLVIRKSDGLTTWGRMTGVFVRATRRREGFWVLVSLGIYGASIVYFVVPIGQVVYQFGASDERVTALFVATLATLGLPLVAVSRAARSGKVVGLVVAVVTGAFVMWGVERSGGERDTAVKEDTVMTIYPVVRSDTAVIERALSGADSAVLERAIWFTSGSDSLTDGAQDTLQTIARVLNQYPAMEVRIEGHADVRGPEDFNMDLGRRRAKAVEAYLALSGLDASRFTTDSHGENDPASEALARNRRVEFTVTRGPATEVLVTADTVLVIEADTVMGLRTQVSADTIIVIEVGKTKPRD